MGRTGRFGDLVDVKDILLLPRLLFLCCLLRVRRVESR